MGAGASEASVHFVVLAARATKTICETSAPRLVGEKHGPRREEKALHREES